MRRYIIVAVLLCACEPVETDDLSYEDDSIASGFTSGEDDSDSGETTSERDDPDDLLYRWVSESASGSDTGEESTG